MEWKLGTIMPIFRKGETVKAKTCRSISLMETGHKLFTEIPRRKL